MVLLGNDRTYNTVVLAAFLHDIGKFFGRAKAQVLGKARHPKLSANFVSAFSWLFQQVADAELLRTLVMKHHEDARSFPEELLVQSIQDPHVRALATLVSRADNLSSMERGRRSEQYQDYRTTPLFSVLERVNRSNDEGLKLRFHLQPLVADERIFPRDFISYNAGEVNSLLKQFGAEFRQVFSSTAGRQWTSFDRLAAHINNVIYKYTWSVPSNTQEAVPDISLFDHLRTTAAIAACLYQYHSTTGTLDERSIVTSPQPRFLLCVGDISGIQTYIFDIATIGAGGVARRLRARSFYVQLCSEVTAVKILTDCNLPLWNLIMNSGGKFYILLPNTPTALEYLESARHEFDGWFLRHMNGELRLNLAYISFADSGFAAGDGAGGFGEILGKLSRELSVAKQRQLATVLQGQGKWNEDAFVLPQTFDGKGNCDSCGKFPEHADGLCWHCWRDLMNGSILPGSRYVALYDTPAKDGFPLLNYNIKLSSDPRFPESPRLVIRLNPTGVSELLDYPVVWKHIAKYVPQSEGATMTFEQIAAQSKGKPLLGYLKADVDNLGKTFVFGLKRSDASLDTVSRQATLSRLLDLFFTGWIEYLVSNMFPECYVVFSGGDDVLLVGPWDRVLELSLRLRQTFAEFTGCPLHDGRLTLSGAIAIVKPDYPVARAVDALNEALELSKNRGRNRVTILGTTLTWQQWSEVLEEWQRLSPLVTEKASVPSAFLRNLIAFGNMWREYVTKGEVRALRFHPLLSYNVRRNLDAKKNPELAAWVNHLLPWPPGEKERRLLDSLALLATLLLYTRKGGD